MELYIKTLINFELPLISFKIIRNYDIYCSRAAKNAIVNTEVEHLSELRSYALLFLGWLPALGKRSGVWEELKAPSTLAYAFWETGT